MARKVSRSLGSVRCSGSSVRLWHMGEPVTELSPNARMLRTVHSSIGVFELGCLSYLWFCAISRHRDRWFTLAIRVLLGEGAALLLAKGCPLGFFQRRAGDDVPMFELWFGPRLAPYAIPSFVALTASGMVTAMARSPQGEQSRTRPGHGHRSGGSMNRVLPEEPGPRGWPRRRPMLATDNASVVQARRGWRTKVGPQSLPPVGRS